MASGKGHVGGSKQLGVARRWERREWLLQRERSKVGAVRRWNSSGWTVNFNKRKF